MTKDEALKLALEALYCASRIMDATAQARQDNAITAIKEALAQPQRTWVELTDDEIWEAYMKAPLTLDCSTDELYALARTVEAKLKEKNNV